MWDIFYSAPDLETLLYLELAEISFIGTGQTYLVTSITLLRISPILLIYFNDKVSIKLFKGYKI